MVEIDKSLKFADCVPNMSGPDRTGLCSRVSTVLCQFVLKGPSASPSPSLFLSPPAVILEKQIRIPRSLSVKAASVLKGFLNKVRRGQTGLDQPSTVVTPAGPWELHYYGLSYSLLSLSLVFLCFSSCLSQCESHTFSPILNTFLIITFCFPNILFFFPTLLQILTFPTDLVSVSSTVISYCLSPSRLLPSHRILKSV